MYTVTQRIKIMIHTILTKQTVHIAIYPQLYASLIRKNDQNVKSLFTTNIIAVHIQLNLKIYFDVSNLCLLGQRVLCGTA